MTRDQILYDIRYYAEKIRNANEELLDDRDFILEAVKINANILLYIDKKHRDDEEIIFTAMSNNVNIIFEASDDIKKKLQFILKTYGDIKKLFE